MKYTVEGKKLVMEVDNSDVKLLREYASISPASRFDRVGSERVEEIRLALGGVGEINKLVVFLCDHWLNGEEGKDA